MALNLYKFCRIFEAKFNGQDAIYLVFIFFLCQLSLATLFSSFPIVFNNFFYNCSKTFPLRAYLKRHQKTMHEDEMQHCKFCPLQFENREFLQIHCGYYHQEDMEVAQLKLTCNYCDQLMGSNLQLQLHIRKYHPTPRFQCSVCDEWFPNLFKLRVHVKQHSQ
jgi:hypothetical protein